MPGSADNISEPENSQDAELDANPLDLVRQRPSRFLGLRGSGVFVLRRALPPCSHLA